MRQQKDQGFATVTAIGVCAALAAVAVGLLQVSLSERQRVDEELQRQERMLAVRSAIAIELARLKERPAVLPFDERVVVGKWTVAVHVSNEQTKVNVLTSDAGSLAAALTRSGVVAADELGDRLIDARAAHPHLKDSPLERILDVAEFTPADAVCAIEALTVYGSSYDPFASGVSGGWDGGIVTIAGHVVAPVLSDEGRERTFVITGDAARPVIELADRRYRKHERERCGDEKA